jgi:hypothetical protein
MPFGAQTYGTDRRESLLDILRDVSPNTDNYLTTNLKKAPAATNTLHSWPIYHTERPTSVTPSVEGAAASYSDLSAPERSSNATVIVDEAIRVSKTQEKIDTINGKDSYEFQKIEALKRLKAKMEFLTVNGVFASGNSGVARGMAGIDGLISTNVTARASGTSFTETELNNLEQLSWDQVGSSYVADVLLCPIVIKRRIATFTANQTRNIDASAKRLTNEIRVYDTDVGQTIMVIPHKDVRKVAGSLTVYLIREELFAHSFLYEPEYEELAKDGLRRNGMYSTEFTTVSYAQRASVKATGYATTL